MASTHYIWKVPTNTLYPNKDEVFIKEYIANSTISPGDLVGLVSGSDYLIEQTDLNATTGAAIIGVAGDNIGTNGDTDVAFDSDYSAGDAVPVVLHGPVVVLTTVGGLTAGLRAGGSNTAGVALNSTTQAEIFGKILSNSSSFLKTDNITTVYRAVVFVGAW